MESSSTRTYNAIIEETVQFEKIQDVSKIRVQNFRKFEEKLGEIVEKEAYYFYVKFLPPF